MNKKNQFNKKSLPQQKNLSAKDKLPKTRQPSTTKDLGLKTEQPAREPLNKKHFSIAPEPEAKPAKGWRAILSKKLVPHEKGWKLYLWYFIVTCLGLAVAGAIGMFVFILLILKDLPSPEEISQINLQSSTKILARDGTLLYEVGDEGARRTVIKYDQIHRHMLNATIAVEDDEFFSHPGFDWKGLTRSVLIDAKNIITGSSSRQGGSTITQQLVKLTFLSPEKTVRRKLSELILAVELEQHYSKEKILEMYLNKIFYGAQSYGVEAASKTYFNKSAKDLTIAESAALAAIPQSPPRYSPYNNKDALLKRQQYILGRMHELGMLNDAEYTKAKNDVLVFSPFKETIRAPHFVFYVLQELEKTYGEQIRGLTVYTTLDSKLQENAELAIKEGAARNDKVYGAKNAGLISIDPKTGEILAMVGSKDYFDDSVDGQVNVVTSKRQPGSTFKAFTYATLFTKGFGSGTVLFDAKTDFGNNYTPFNYDGKFRGPVTVRTALSNSLNVPAVASQYLAGVEDTLSLVHTMGVEYVDKSLAADNGLALALGVEEITPIDMVRAFSVFANNGVRRDTGAILKITNDQGEEIWQRSTPVGEEVLDPQAAFLVNDILSDTGARPSTWSNLAIPGQVVAAKTGTSINIVNNIKRPKDLWTIGYTPNIVTGVWVGNNQGDIPTLTADGLTTAAPIWKNFMTKALAGQTKQEFERPEGIKDVAISINSGLLPSATTPSDKIRTELFPSYGIPKLVEQGFQSAKVDQISGKLATEACPENTVLYVYQDYHSLLYYVRPDDPALQRWEDAVRAWAATNQNTSGQGTTVPTTAEGTPVVYIDDPSKIPTDTCNIVPSASVGIDMITPGEGDKIANGPNQAHFSINNPRDISKISAYFDNKLISEYNAVPFDNLSYTIPATALGSVHSLRFVFTLQDGRQVSEQVGVIISDDTASPTIILNSPRENEILRAGESFELNANVTDDKTIERVEFFFDGTPIITLQNSPYITSYLIPVDTNQGTHEIMVRAFDSNDNVTRLRRKIIVQGTFVSDTLTTPPILSPTTEVLL